MSRIVLTTDFSDAARQAYAPTLELARALQATVTVLHVVPELRVLPHGAPFAPPITSPEVDEEVEDAEAAMQKLRKELGGKAALETAVLVGADVVTTITKYAADHHASFIAVATHGRTGVRHLVLGSVAEAIVRHASVPVICFPAKKE
jgi:nucleotide-binding universal stress UspA family protein